MQYVRYVRLELTCPASDTHFWLAWLLGQHEGIVDVIRIQRYGLDTIRLNRQEQVYGYAHYVRFSITLTEQRATALQSQISDQQVQHHKSIEMCILTLQFAPVQPSTSQHSD